MNKREKKILYEIISDMQKKEDSAMLKEIEEAANNPMYQNKDGDVEKFLAKHEKQKKKKNFKAISKVAAAIICLFIISAFTVPINVEGSKQSLFELIIDSSRSDSVIIGYDQLLTYDGKYVPSLIPRGYDVESINSTDNFKSIVITNHTDNTIVYSEYNTDDISISLPQYSDATEMDINGFNALYSKSDTSQMIIVYAEDKIFTISCSNTDYDLIGFALLVELRY